MMHGQANIKVTLQSVALVKTQVSVVCMHVPCKLGQLNQYLHWVKARQQEFYM